VKAEVLALADVDENLIRCRWEDSLTAYVLPRPGFVRKYASLTTNFGSIDRAFTGADGHCHHVPAGAAHFLEHKMFEDPSRPVLDRFADLGASANAYTSYEVTSYLFSCADDFPRCLDLLLDFVRGAHFTREGIEKEKPIIEQEIRMGLDSPHRTIMYNLRRLLYQRHPIRDDIAGTVESVRSTTYEDLELCYQAFYHPANLVLFVAGDVQPEAVLEQVDRHLARQPGGPAPVLKRERVEEPAALAGGRAEERMAVAIPLLAFGYKDPAPGQGREGLRRRVAGEMALEMVMGRSSDLFHHLYRDGLIDDTFGGSYSGGRDWAFTAFMGRTSDPYTLASRLREGMATAAWTPGDLERCRRASLGQFVSFFDSLEAPAYVVTDLHFEGLELADYYRALREVDEGDVRRYQAEAWREEAAATSVVLPK